MKKLGIPLCLLFVASLAYGDFSDNTWKTLLNRTVVVEKNDGSTASGELTAFDAGEIVIVTQDGTPVEVKRGDVKSVRVQTVATAAQAGAQTTGKAATEQSGHERLPTASIRIDGDFSDWSGIQPAFSVPASTKGKLGIDKVFLAVDSERLYMKFDIADVTRPSFFVPYNFDTNHNSMYGLDVENGSKHLVVQVQYDSSNQKNHWNSQTVALRNGKWEILDQSFSNFSMKGSSLETSFPLSVIKDFLGPLAPGTAYKVTARTGYDDSQWNWIEGVGEGTPPKLFVF